MKFQVTFEYEANPSNYDTSDPEEMANIDLDQIHSGELDIADLIDEVSVGTVKITPVDS